jgi:hypothetical protein
MMNNLEIRVAVAQQLGWYKDINYDKNKLWNHKDWVSSRRAEELPKFEEDLNAAYNMEENLSASERLTYYRILRDSVASVFGPKGSIIGVNDFSILHASATERCEAFLRVRREWVE